MYRSPPAPSAGCPTAEQEPDIAEIVVTNTVPLPPEKRLSNIVTRPVAPLFAEAVHRIHARESIGSLFSSEETHG